MAAAVRYLVSCTGVTGPNILIDKLSHSGPDVVLYNLFQPLVLSQMAGHLPVMMCL